MIEISVHYTLHFDSYRKWNELTSKIMDQAHCHPSFWFLLAYLCSLKTMHKLMSRKKGIQYKCKMENKAIVKKYIASQPMQLNLNSKWSPLIKSMNTYMQGQMDEWTPLVHIYKHTDTDIYIYTKKVQEYLWRTLTTIQLKQILILLEIWHTIVHTIFILGRLCR